MTLPLEDLLDRVSTALRDLPGAMELYGFGSAFDPAARDEYSDLDLQVISADYSLSRAAFPWILGRAGAIELAYPLSEKPQESAFSLALENESPYHKIDLGLCDRQNAGELIFQLEKKVLLWRQPARLAPLALSPGQAYLPEPGSAAHFLAGELLGSVRYCKARRRGQHLACWRFASAKLNALVSCYRWDGGPRRFPQAALTTWDFTALDRSLPAGERLGLLENLRFATPDEMDRTLVDLTRAIAARICPAYPTEETPLARLIRKYTHFIGDELQLQ